MSTSQDSVKLTAEWIDAQTEVSPEKRAQVKQAIAQNVVGLQSARAKCEDIRDAAKYVKSLERLSDEDRAVELELVRNGEISTSRMYRRYAAVDPDWQFFPCRVIWRLGDVVEMPIRGVADVWEQWQRDKALSASAKLHAERKAIEPAASIATGP